MIQRVGIVEADHSTSTVEDRSFEHIDWEAHVVGAASDAARATPAKGRGSEERERQIHMEAVQTCCAHPRVGHVQGGRTCLTRTSKWTSRNAARTVPRTTPRASANVGSVNFEDGPGIARFSSAAEPKTALNKVKAFLTGPFKGAKLDREYLGKLGLGALLSYGFVSNINAITIVIISWVTTGRTTGLSPLATGNWKVFVATYTALYLSFGNLLRPLRISISIAISPFFKALVDKIKHTFKVAQPVAIGITVFLVNVCGTLSYLIGGVWLASLICRVPLLP